MTGAGIAGAVGMLGAMEGALRGDIGRGAALSSSFWRAVISAMAKSKDAGLIGGDGR
jgi:hypothetical protein